MEPGRQDDGSLVEAFFLDHFHDAFAEDFKLRLVRAELSRFLDAHALPFCLRAASAF